MIFSIGFIKNNRGLSESFMPFFQLLLQRLWGLLPVTLVLFILGLVGILLINAAPDVKRLVGVQVQANPNSAGVVLGWEALGQYVGANSAEKNHLKVHYEPKQGWQLSNLAIDKKVDAQTTRFPTRFIRRFALQVGDRLIAKNFDIEVKQTQPNHLVLYDRNNKVTAQWQGSALSFNHQRPLYSYCDRRGIKAVVSQWRDHLYWAWFSKDNPEEKRLFSVGGQVDCTTRWAQTNVKPDSLRFSWMDNRFWIGAGRHAVRVQIKRGTKSYDLNQVSLAVNGSEGNVKRLILGRTHYQLSATDKRFSLLPTHNQPVFIQASPNTQVEDAEQQQALKVAAQKRQQEAEKRTEAMKAQGIFTHYANYDWIGDIPTGRAVSTVNLAIAWGITLLLASFVLTFRQGYHQVNYSLRISGLVVSLLLAITVSLLVLSKATLGTLLSFTWLMALWATFIQFFSGRLHGLAARIWWLGLLLAGIGLLVLTQLAVGSDNTRWLSFPAETAFWLIQLGLWVALLALAPLENVMDALMRLLHPAQYRLVIGKFSLPHFAYLGLISGVVALLIAQSLGGKEEGVFGIQPVELAKFAFIIAMARLLWFLRDIRTIYSEHYQNNRTAILFKLFLSTFAVVLLGAFLLAFGVNDNSPIFIVSFLSLAFLWLALIDPLVPNSRSQWLSQGAIVLLALFILVMGTFLYFNPPAYNSHFPQAERFRSWSNPLLYPEAASQLLNSLQRVGEGNWLGTGWFGQNGVVMSLPAVQDDFIAAFMLNRFGGWVGMLLMTVQFLWLVSLFKLSTWLRTTQAAPQVQTAFQLLGYVLFGLAWVHLLHWLISWSNILGWLPIMGQPMTWLSAGNSHLLVIGVPTLLFGLIAAWIKQLETPQ